MPQLAVSSWSLHRVLGPMYHPAEGRSGALVPHDDTPGALSLLEIPAYLSNRGIRNLEICHFHFPHLDKTYFAELQAALADADVNLYSILIDSGDITSSDTEQRSEDLAWIRSWIEIAGQCSADHARVVAGNTQVAVNENGMHDHDVVRLSAENLRSLASFGRDHGVQIITENWKPLTERPETLLAILDLCEGEVGLCADFGNYHGPTKYHDLAAILPRATSIHAKAHYPQAGQMLYEDFTCCLTMARETSFDGAYSLIFDGPGSEWESLAEIQQVVEEYL